MYQFTFARASALAEAYLSRTYAHGDIRDVRVEQHGEGWLVLYKHVHREAMRGGLVTDARCAFAHATPEGEDLMFAWDFICAAMIDGVHPIIQGATS